MTHERRKHPRIPVKVPVYIDCYDDDGEIMEQKAGIALDISIGGILIETRDLIDANYVKVKFIKKNNKKLGIIGSVVHSSKKESGKVKTGLCFHGDDKENTRFATDIIRAHYHRENRIQPETRV